MYKEQGITFQPKTNKNFNNKIKNDKIMKIKEELINSKIVDIILNSIDIGNYSYIIFFKSENKNKIFEMISKYNDIISIKDIKEYKDELNNKEKKKNEYITFI